MKSVIIINLSANGGSAEEGWYAIEQEVLEQMPKNTEVCKYHVPFDLDDKLSDWLDSGINCFIIGGGDGTINYVLNMLCERFGSKLQHLFYGAIGLGSSNDFHKPIQKSIKKYPVKINLNSSKLIDLGKVKFIDINDNNVTRYFIINSSVGVTAEANLLFNRGDWFINFLKPRSTNATILYTAVKSIIAYKNIHGVLEFDGSKSHIDLSNLAILKNPNVSGSFRFDQNIRLDDSLLGMNVCIHMKKLELIKTLRDLNNGIFSGKKNRLSKLVRKVSFSTEHLIALETDGDVMMGKNIVYYVCPKAINILST